MFYNSTGGVTHKLPLGEMQELLEDLPVLAALRTLLEKSHIPNIKLPQAFDSSYCIILHFLLEVRDDRLQSFNSQTHRVATYVSLYL